MKFVYGPVPSRRLGQSLGVDPIPLKTCNWNCVYCQLGRTMPLTNERQEYIPKEEILSQVKESLAAHNKGEIDWITFVGSGEPTLHSGIGWLIREVKTISEIPIAVITNGALLYLSDVRQELLDADAVLPSLDAGEQSLYRKINRPYGKITFERHLNGLIAFREEYQGSLWVEAMLVRGLNDTEAALRDLAAALDAIQPDEVHINLPTRPPVESWVQPPDKGALSLACEILGKIAHIVRPISGTFDLSGDRTLIDALIGIITRHPMREDQIIKSLESWMPDEIRETLIELSDSGQVKVVQRYGTRFWHAAASYFPDQ